MSKARETVYAELRRKLMAGVFAPGERLREEHIASEMSVSRTPVRSAIQRLVDDGLVKIEENKGAVVIGWTSRDIAEIFDLRLLLEPYAAGVAAETATDEQINKLEQINDEMHRLVISNQADRIGMIQNLNNQFHHLLIDSSQSGRLKSLIEKFLDMPIIIGSFYFYSKDEMLKSVEHHRQIILALKMKNRKYAEICTTFHLTATFALFKNHSANQK